MCDHHYAPYLLLFSLPRASLVGVSRAVMGTCTPPRAECRHRGQPAGGDLVPPELSQRLRSQPLCKHTIHTRMECPDRRRHITTPPRSVMPQGVVETTRQFLGMLRASKGRVINVGSIAGDVGQLPGWTQYTSSEPRCTASSLNSVAPPTPLSIPPGPDASRSQASMPWKPSAMDCEWR
jgi:hypothetical protein